MSRSDLDKNSDYRYKKSLFSEWDKFAHYEYIKLTHEDNDDVDGDDVKID